jgi:RNA polymerase sigma-70 factor (ECF subfamily)
VSPKPVTNRTAGVEFRDSVREPARTPFDARYVQLLRDGDAETERHFVAYFGELLRIKLGARLRSPQAIEDLRQETFLRVLTAIRLKNSLESPERLGAFVNSVCNNLLFELYRHKSRKESVGFDQLEPVDKRKSAEADLLTQERREQIQQVLDELPEKDRRLLRMVFYEDADKDEICSQFNVDRDYLRVLVHRAKGRFRELLVRRHGGNFQAQAKVSEILPGKGLEFRSWITN